MLALFLNVYFCNLICPTLPPCFISVLLGVFVSVASLEDNGRPWSSAYSAVLGRKGWFTLPSINISRFVQVLSCCVS